MWEQSKRRVVSNPITLPNGVVAVAEYALIPNRACIRLAVLFYNPNDTMAVNLHVDMVTDLASDETTRIEKRSSSSFGRLNITDRWVITDDNGSDSDPVVTSVFYGNNIFYLIKHFFLNKKLKGPGSPLLPVYERLENPDNS